MCGQVSVLKLRLTFCEYWICVQVTFLSVRADNLADSAAETTKVGPRTPAALAFVGNTWSWEALGSIEIVLLSVSIQYVTFIVAAWALPTAFLVRPEPEPASSILSVPWRKPIFDVPPPTILLSGDDLVLISNFAKDSMF